MKELSFIGLVFFTARIKAAASKCGGFFSVRFVVMKLLYLPKLGSILKDSTVTGELT